MNTMASILFVEYFQQIKGNGYTPNENKGDEIGIYSGAICTVQISVAIILLVPHYELTAGMIFIFPFSK